MMTVREECKRRFGDKPCTETAECRDWCPLLRIAPRRIAA